MLQKDVLDFQIELWCRYFGGFWGLTTVLATFSKIWAIFSNLLVTLITV
jgi:hypothetical protein